MIGFDKIKYIRESVFNLDQPDIIISQFKLPINKKIFKITDSNNNEIKNYDYTDFSGYLTLYDQNVEVIYVQFSIQTKEVLKHSKVKTYKQKLEKLKSILNNEKKMSK